jgi:hypothetical protein
MEFIESERGNQKLNLKLKKICGGQLSYGGYCPRGAIVRGAIVLLPISLIANDAYSEIRSRVPWTSL